MHFFYFFFRLASSDSDGRTSSVVKDNSLCVCVCMHARVCAMHTHTKIVRERLLSSCTENLRRKPLSTLENMKDENENETQSEGGGGNWSSLLVL